MRKVFDNSMVAHVWAQQSQSEGKSNNGQFYFSGRALYSYGSHFMVGYIMPDKTALMNSDSYSISTSRHQSEARGAVNYKYLSVPALTSIKSELARIEHGDAGAKKRAGSTLRAFVLTHAEKLDDQAGAYLLSLTGLKSGAFDKVKAQAIKAREKKEQAEKRATLKTQVAYGARAAKLAGPELISGLANVFRNGRGAIEKQATQLYHAHRALKATKREKQAAKVWHILQLVRAEVKRLDAIDARKNANQHLSQTLSGLRNNLESMQRALAIGHCTQAMVLSGLANQFAALVRSSRIPAATRIKLASWPEAFTQAAHVAQEHEERERQLKQQERRAAWLRGENVRPDFYGEAVTLLRAIGVTRNESGTITGGLLQTSRGAEVPLTHAVRAFRFIKLCREQHAPANARQEAAGNFPVDVIAWQRNGHSVRVGHFTLDTIWASGNFRAGCHTITWPEVERIARQLGVFDVAASDAALTPSNEAA